MKKQTTIAAIFMAALAGTAMFSSCGSPKQVAAHASATEVVDIPFTESKYKSDKDFFRATQSGKSPDLSAAKKIALQNAKQEMGGLIESLIKAVSDNYTKQITVGDQQEYQNNFEEEGRSIVKQTLNDVRIIGEKVFKENGKITFYVAIEMDRKAVQNAFADKISSDAKLQLQYDQAKFAKTFDEEMAKLENR